MSECKMMGSIRKKPGVNLVVGGGSSAGEAEGIPFFFFFF